ncbi:uncharacterized protein LOC131321152 [Rhododendron vialii]|uniref:uncharacterized protein LOC131321152 n=1 Tax=Rhododendron vialii TaxID=182163 RepID=UPI00265F970A|nr:uncharacterized protein LOC131321152 [Rhododendron vialii]
MSTISPLMIMNTPSSCPPITTEEFNTFHAIDRALYTLLIFALGRDPAESMRVMGLLLWLERNGPDFRLVKRMLSMKTSLVNSVADESVVCLNCVETDGWFRFDPHGNDLPLLRSLLRRDLSLRFFHENRVSVLCGVTKIVSEVCARAFEDITTRILGHRNPIFVGSSSSCGVPPLVVAGGGGAGGDLSVPYYPGIAVASNMDSGGLTGNVAQTVPFMATTTPHHGVSREENIGVVNYQMVPRGGGGGGGEGGVLAVQGYDHSNYNNNNNNNNDNDVNDQQRRFLNEEMGELFGSLSLQGEGTGGGEERQLVPPDDRTIFLTFSKGYPISVNEVRDFFTRKYGEIFEAIHMQEVGAEEQMLYARLVARSASSVGVVLGGQRKARFSINGKHVWARKYIKKHPKSPLITTTATTSSTATNSPTHEPSSSLAAAAATPQP